MLSSGTYPSLPEIPLNASSLDQFDDQFALMDSGSDQGVVVLDDGYLEICNDGDACFDPIGNWTIGRNGYQRDVRFSAAGQGADMARWSFQVTPGMHRVSATWTAHSNRAKDAPFTIRDGSNPLATVDVDQELRPNDFHLQGAWWEDLGTFWVSGGTLTVELTDDADEYVIADAVRVERIGGGAPPTIGSLSVSPDPVTRSDNVVLTANDVSNGDGTVGFVEFFRDANGNGILESTSDQYLGAVNASRGWSWLGSTSSFPLGINRYFARAKYYDGQLSGVVTATGTVLNDAFLEICNDGDACFDPIGNWTVGRNGYQRDVHFSAAGQGADVARWTFQVTTGVYRVSATWTSHPNRAKDAPFTIRSGSDPIATVDINQELRPNDFHSQGAWWEDLGAFWVSGNTLTVELTDDADEYVIADAVRVERIRGGAPPTIGSLSVSPDPVTWPDNVVLTANDVSDSDGTVALVEFFRDANGNGVLDRTTDQYLGVADSSDGWSWSASITSFPPGINRYFVRALDNDGLSSGAVTTTGTVLADGYVEICNDGDACFDTVGNWNVGRNGYRRDVHYSAAGEGADVARWTFRVTPGMYRVSSTWTAHPNRATDAPFTIRDGVSQLATVYVDQEFAPNGFDDQGTAWEKLGGPYAISGDSLVVELSNDGNEYVIADAIRIERVVDAG